MKYRIRILVALLATVALTAPLRADSPDARVYIERAVELIRTGAHALARTYLGPAVIDPRLSAPERSRAYYLRGFSHYAEQHYVSARKDFVRALEFNPDNAAAQVGLGGLYYRGEGVGEDAPLALGFFTQAKAQGHPEAALYLGFAYLEGRGVEKDLEAARGHLETAAGQGVTHAMVLLARSYREPVADVSDPALAQSWYERAAEEGDPDGLVGLAYMHREGEFGRVDMDAALRLFWQAAAAGSSIANLSLGHMYLVGEGTLPDPGRARELFELAVSQGNHGGSVNLGHMYEVGLGVEQDIDAARDWYLAGAAADHPEAQLRLFYLLLREGEYDEAASWLARAAAHDLPQAHNDYAWLLATSEEDHFRDGHLALEYAERAVAREPSAAYLDTLAAAYAELGRWQDAIETQQRALALLEDAESAEARALSEHLEAYQASRPWRE